MGRQKSNPQRKEKEKSPEKELNEFEASSLSEIEFRVMVIRMFIQLDDKYTQLNDKYTELNENYKELNENVTNMKRNQEEMKNDIAAIKNTMEGLKSRLEEAEDHISELEDKSELKPTVANLLDLMDNQWSADHPLCYQFGSNMMYPGIQIWVLGRLWRGTGTKLGAKIQDHKITSNHRTQIKAPPTWKETTFFLGCPS
ncbi:hypothetical protein QTO34_000558 [Cnephaeus nilssonii]|uniref:Uncharacterized protein n=1 Tax=Cnephaeus nilssonii TaxID=3371016 RepID=A0AA40IBS1_CNENI|nr:hypothetical protein QTO34_000558 [Eptesicus nilssonii]